MRWLLFFSHGERSLGAPPPLSVRRCGHWTPRAPTGRSRHHNSGVGTEPRRAAHQRWPRIRLPWQSMMRCAVLWRTAVLCPAAMLQHSSTAQHSIAYCYAFHLRLIRTGETWEPCWTSQSPSDSKGRVLGAGPGGSISCPSASRRQHILSIRVPAAAFYPVQMQAAAPARAEGGLRSAPPLRPPTVRAACQPCKIPLPAWAVGIASSLVAVSGPNCSLSVGRCPWDAVHGTLSRGRCPWDAVQGTLSMGRCPGNAVHGTLSGGRCPGDAVRGTLSGGRCPGDAVQGTLSSGRCPGDAVQGTLSRGRCPG
eukprot:gene10231-biopygen3280